MLDSAFQIIRGDNETLVFTIVDETNARVVLTGCVATLTIKLSDSKPETVLTKLHTTHVDDNLAQGVIAFSLLKADTQIAPGSYKFDLQLNLLSGKRKTALGAVEVIGDLNWA